MPCSRGCVIKKGVVLAWLSVAALSSRLAVHQVLMYRQFLSAPCRVLAVFQCRGGVGGYITAKRVQAHACAAAQCTGGELGALARALLRLSASVSRLC